MIYISVWSLYRGKWQAAKDWKKSFGFHKMCGNAGTNDFVCASKEGSIPWSYQVNFT
jgi:hypothetical protein